MDKTSRIVLLCIASIGIIIILAMLFHLGGSAWQFSQMTGAIVGGCLTLFAALARKRRDEQVEPWLGRERVAWIFIGCGLILWGTGESIWVYYIFSHRNPFPSYADIGYSGLPPLVFTGLLLQPSSGVGSRRFLMLLDSLITMISMLTIGWYVLLGSLALASNENVLAKFLGLYYPTTDIALLSCVILLLFRSQGSLYQAMARRISLIVMGAGLCFFAGSDFVFNMQQNAGTYVNGTWVDIGWPIGLLLIGIAAYLRRFWPLTSDDVIEQRLRSHSHHSSISLAQVATYAMLGALCVVLILNVLSTSASQVSIRPILVLSTVLVIGLVVARQLLTIHENERLYRRQTSALERLEVANQRIEEQARMIAQRNAELEEGIRHLKDVQASMANGNLRARARLSNGALLPLAASLNLMADRLSHLEHSYHYAQRLTRALQELVASIERVKTGEQFKIPVSCKSFPDIVRLVYVIGLKEKSGDVSLSLSGLGPGSVPFQIFSKPGVPPTFPPNQASQPMARLDPHITGANNPVARMSDERSNDEAITPLPETFLETRKESTGEKKRDMTP